MNSTDLVDHAEKVTGARKSRLVMMFHPSHRVPDLAEAERFFDRAFGVPSQRLDALVGAPSTPDNRLDYSIFTPIRDLIFDTIDPRRYIKQGIQRYPSVDRPRLNGFGWYVDGVGEVYRQLRLNGYTIVDQRGEPVTGDQPPAADGGGLPMYWLTPQDAGLRYQFLPLIPFPGDPRVAAGWQLPPVSDDDPLGLVRCSHHTVLTGRPERAVRLFIDVLGGRVIHRGRNEIIGATSTYIHLADGVYEFAVPDPDVVAYDHWRRDAPGDAYHAITFQVADLDMAARHLEAAGVRFRTRSESAVVTDPETSLGIAWGFVPELIPGDPRRS